VVEGEALSSNPTPKKMGFEGEDFVRVTGGRGSKAGQKPSSVTPPRKVQQGSSGGLEPMDSHLRTEPESGFLVSADPG
jgi:hypothetical protein